MTERSSHRPDQVAERLYRLLLRAYPRWFRERYGDEMCRFFRDGVEAARDRAGRRGVAAHATVAAMDVVRGGVAERTQELARRWREGGRLMDHAVKDIRYALRMLRRSPLFTLVAVTTLALGVGATTAIFSVVQSVLLRPLPFPEPDRLVVVWSEMVNRGVMHFPASPPDLKDFRDRSTLIDELGGIFTFNQPIGADDGTPELVPTAGVTTNFFSVFGVRPRLGRDFVEADGLPGDPNARVGQPGFLNNVALLTHGLWQQRFGGDPGIVGRTIDVGGVPTEVAGVLPDGFRLLMPAYSALGAEPVLYFALRIDYATAPPNNAFLRVIGRLAPGVTVAQAGAEMERIGAELRRLSSIKESSGWHPYVRPLHAELVSDVRPVILPLMGAVVFVLLIACANVANLLLVRASGRERELAVRAAVGGSRRRLIEQMLAESLVLTLLGAALGVVVAIVAIPILLSVSPTQLPRSAEIGIDVTVLAFAVGCALASALMIGLVPALRASRPHIGAVLREGGRAPGLGVNRLLRNGAVVVEVALALVLLIGAGLMVRSFRSLQRVDPGFDSTGVLTFAVTLPFGRYPEARQRTAFNREMQERLAALPGVVSASATSPLPLSGGLANIRWGTADAIADPQQFRQADVQFVLPGYFETIGTRLIAGRTFTVADNVDSAAVMIIDEKLAARAFPGRSAVGERLYVRVFSPEPDWVEVVGVVEHQRSSSLMEEGREEAYFTDVFGGGFGINSWLLRTGGDPLALVESARAQLAAVDPGVPMAQVRELRSYVDDAMGPTRFALTLIGLFGAVATLLAALGLYGVLAYAVRMRRAEIGVRIAFGASRPSILGLIVRHGLVLSIAGVAAGTLAAFGATRLLARMLFGVTPTDPGTFASIAGLFLAIAALASALPAWRAARVDPAIALRED